MRKIKKRRNLSESDENANEQADAAKASESGKSSSTSALKKSANDESVSEKKSSKKSATTSKSLTSKSTTTKSAAASSSKHVQGSRIGKSIAKSMDSQSNGYDEVGSSWEEPEDSSMYSSDEHVGALKRTIMDGYSETMESEDAKFSASHSNSSSRSSGDFGSSSNANGYSETAVDSDSSESSDESDSDSSVEVVRVKRKQSTSKSPILIRSSSAHSMKSGLSGSGEVRRSPSTPPRSARNSLNRIPSPMLNRNAKLKVSTDVLIKQYDTFKSVIRTLAVCVCVCFRC